MKARESGMPDESMWEGFFDPRKVLAALGLSSAVRDVVEFGCGYGTFTIPAARIIRGRVYAFDVEAATVKCVRTKVLQAGINNVVLQTRDLIEQGTGLPNSSVDYAMLFNILHAEWPDVLLREVMRVLARVDDWASCTGTMIRPRPAVHPWRSAHAPNNAASGRNRWDFA